MRTPTIVASATGVAMLALLATMVHIRVEPPPAEVPATEVARQGQVEKVGLANEPARITQPNGPADSGTVPLDHPLLTVPVQGVARSAIYDSWGDPRQNGLREHHGTDIMAPKDTPVVAAAPGRIEKLFFSHGGGGITLYVRSPDRLWSYYYAHLGSYAPGVHEGQQVAAGEVIAFVGDTGNAGPANYHLHFGMSRMLPEERWWQGVAVNPYPLLAGTGAPG